MVNCGVYFSYAYTHAYIHTHIHTHTQTHTHTHTYTYICKDETFKIISKNELQIIYIVKNGLAVYIISFTFCYFLSSL